MKMIDFLKKIAERKDMPERVQFEKNIFVYKKGKYTETKEYYHEVTGISLNNTISFNEKDLNADVVILEEKFENIEEVELNGLIDQSLKNKEFKNKINQLIKNQKKILERLENGTLD